jgi:hypothetical protein
MVLFSCPNLGSEVELTDEREQHIAEQHPDLLPAHRQKIADTLTKPDQVRRSTRFGIPGFSRAVLPSYAEQNTSWSSL